MKDTTESQVDVIIRDINLGYRINRVMYSWIPDFRSRICDAQNRLGVTFDRAYIKGKRYKEYWLSQNKLSV